MIFLIAYLLMCMIERNERSIKNKMRKQKQYEPFVN